ncbi:MAG: hypothetical protein EBZ59_04925 [Planctomycetia bacterium]|nr:hypothetical protein [Planctomycetia bacterium]
MLAAAAGTALFLGAGRPRWPEAVGFAALVCLVSGLGGWLAARRKPADPAQAVAGALAASALRIMLPLAALAWLPARAAPLRDAGADRLIVAFYLPLLATTILLHMMDGSRSRRRSPETN